LLCFYVVYVLPLEGRNSRTVGGASSSVALSEMILTTSHSLASDRSTTIQDRPHVALARLLLVLTLSR